MRIKKLLLFIGGVFFLLISLSLAHKQVAYADLLDDIKAHGVGINPEMNGKVQMQWLNVSTLQVTTQLSPTEKYNNSLFPNVAGSDGQYHLQDTPGKNYLTYTKTDINATSPTCGIAYVFTNFTQDAGSAAGHSNGKTFTPSDGNATFVITTPNPAVQDQCIYASTQATPSSAANRNIWFHWISSSSVETLGRVPILIKIAGTEDHIEEKGFSQFLTSPGGDPTIYYGNWSDKDWVCKSQAIPKTDKTSVALRLYRGGSNDGADCPTDDNFAIADKFIDPDSINCTTTSAGCAALNPLAPTTDSNTSTGATCEASGFTLNWLLCPIFNGIADFSQWILKNIVQPFLVVPPISTNSQDPSFQAWSTFRTYGNIFLVIALLVVVFGQSIGGGLIDAYTAKKVLPRLLVAVILVNLSVYIVAALVDLTNIVGKDVSSLLVEPFKTAGFLNFSPNGTQIAGVFGAGILGVILGAGALSGVLLPIIFGVLAGGAGLAAALGPIVLVGLLAVLPMILAVLAVFATLVIRQGIILLLIIISPVAFALYVLPNTEQYFRRWWKLLFETLLVYPIIMILFAVADILSGTILKSNGIQAACTVNGACGFSGNVASGLQSIVAIVVAFLLQFIPLLAAPFAFRIAGGAIGRLHEMITAGAEKANSLAESRRQIEKRRYQSQGLQARQRLYSTLQDTQSRHPGRLSATRLGAGFLANRVGGYNIEAAMSGHRAETAKIINEQINAGKDEEIRGLTVNKKWALNNGVGARWDSSLNDGDGGWRNVRTNAEMTEAQAGLADYRTGADGTRQFRSLGGAWIGEADVDTGHGRWGRDTFAQQAALSYEQRKAQTDEQRQRVISHYYDVARGEGGWGMNNQQSYGAWIGASFENQNNNLQYKYANKQNPDGSARAFDHRGYVEEVYEKRGSYPMSQMDATSIERLTEAHRTGAAPREQLEAIARTMQDRLAAAGRGQPQPGDEGLMPGASGLGSGHVADEMNNFVRTVLGGNGGGGQAGPAGPAAGGPGAPYRYP